MSKRKAKIKARVCPFCKCPDSVFVFEEEKDVGLSCARCGAFGPRVHMDFDFSDEAKWNLAAEAWNKIEVDCNPPKMQ